MEYILIILVVLFLIVAAFRLNMPDNNTWEDEDLQADVQEEESQCNRKETVLGVDDISLNAKSTIKLQRDIDVSEAYREPRITHSESRIKVIGIGELGADVVNRMIKNPNENTEYAILTIRSEVAYTLKVANVYLMNEEDPYTYKDINTQTDYEKYYAIHLNHAKLINFILGDALRHLIIVCEVGEAFATHHTKWISTIAQNNDIPVSVVCSFPFYFEGKDRLERATEAVRQFKETEACIRVIHADDLISIYPNATFLNALDLLAEQIADIVGVFCEMCAVSRSQIGKIID
jgi:cell division GTPase FtsZ